MELLSKILSIPPIGKMALKGLKKEAFKPYHVPLQRAIEKQDKMIEAKLKKMEGTEIGRKLGMYKGVRLQDLPVTDYSFYEPFYKNPSSKAFMYPLENYKEIKTSGTAGKEKSYLLPKKKILRSFRETALQMILALFHDGEKIALEYGDNLYVNSGPAPFIGGSTISLGSKKIPIFNFTPNVNLSYKEKVQYFILNYKKIDAAFVLSSTLISQIMPAIKEPIKLKGFATIDTPEVEIYRDEIERFTDTVPKSFYASTETVACSVMSIQHSMGFIFDLRRGLFEFFPVKKGEVEKKSIGIDEVTVGQVYQLVYTDFDSELTRFNTKDSFKCIAKGDDILNTDFPIFRFQGRLDKTISLQNVTRISEEELLMAFKEADIPFVDFTTKVESERGLEFIGIYLEHAGNMKSEEIRDAIHERLYMMDNDYKALADFFDYTPLKIYPIPNGVFAKYLEVKGGSVPKIDRIKMNDEDFEKLARLIKSSESAD